MRENNTWENNTWGNNTWGKEKFLKEFFLPPHPYPVKNFNEGIIFIV